MAPDEVSIREDKLASLKKMGECAAQGDAEAFEKIYRRLRRGILAFLVSRGADAIQARDLSEEAFAIFWRRCANGQFNPVTSPSTYIIRICEYLWIDSLRKQDRQKNALFAFWTMFRDRSGARKSHEDPVPFEKDAELETLRECCNVKGTPWSLTHDERRLLYERFWKSGSLRSVATVLAIGTTTVGDREQAVLDKLRRCFEKKGYGKNSPSKRGSSADND